MTKVFLAISNHADLLGGGEHSFIELLSHLLPPWKPIAVVPERGEVASRIEESRIDISVTPLPPIRPWNIISMIKTIRSCAQLCKREKARFIYANGSRAAFYGGLAGRLSRRPVIWHCRISRRDNSLDPILTRLSSVIIANSRATALRFKRELSWKVRVVHNGVNLEWLRDKGIAKPALVHKEWKVILLVARISRWKRHDLALAAFEHIASSDPCAHLVCVGAQDLLESQWWAFLQERSLKSPFSSRIHWIGQVGDIRPWYRAAHVLLLTSEDESFGRVLVEAMACGVPVIAPHSGGVPEIVREGQDGFFFTHGRLNEIVDAILRITQDERLRRELSRSAVERANSFGVEKYVQGVMRVFEAAIEKQ